MDVGLSIPVGPVIHLHTAANAESTIQILYHLEKTFLHVMHVALILKNYLILALSAA